MIIDIVAAGILAEEAPKTPVPAMSDDDRAIAALSIYRNNVRAALSRALGETFPVIAALVGDEFFRAMARAYFASQPPRSPMIVDYGRRFPEFLSSFAPAASLPYLADVARLEWAWLMAYRAADAASLDSDAIMDIGGGDPAVLRFELHPSVAIVSSPFPVASIWRRNQPGGAAIQIDAHSGEDVLIIRPENVVDMHALAPGAATALKSLQRGETIAQSCARAMGETPEFDPQALFTLILSTGFATAASTDNPTKGH